MNMTQIISSLMDMANASPTSLTAPTIVEINGVEYSVEAIVCDRTGKEPKIRIELK